MQPLAGDLLVAHLLDGHFFPAALQQEGMVGRVAKDQAADEDSPLTLSHHGVPHGGGVVAALEAVPGARDLPVGGGDARLDQLALGGDLTCVGVDEEDGHGDPA